MDWILRGLAGLSCQPILWPAAPSIRAGRLRGLERPGLLASDLGSRCTEYSSPGWSLPGWPGPQSRVTKCGCGPRAPTMPGAGQADQSKWAVCMCVRTEPVGRSGSRGRAKAVSVQLRPTLACSARHCGPCCQHWKALARAIGGIAC